MLLEFDSYSIEPIHEKHAWRICDFCTSNASRLKRFFPGTLKENLTPDLSNYFVAKKVKQFAANEEFLYVLKDKEAHSVIGLIYLKALDWTKKQGELAYAIGYQYEGKGYTSKSIAAISNWAFKEHHLKTLQIIAHKTNIGSIKVAQNNGFIWKATLAKEHTPPGESALDMELYERYL